LLEELDTKEYPVIEDIYLPKNTILYHGSKTGDLIIDYNKTIPGCKYHFLYFTEDYDMAKEYALRKSDILEKSLSRHIPTVYGETLIKKLTSKNINKRKII